MLIGIISDIHENFHNLILSLNKMEALGVEQIICLGDLMNAGVAKMLVHHTIPSYLIWGNNDGEKVDIVKAAHLPNSQLTVSNNTYDFLKFGNRNIFITHYDDLARPMAETGRYDVVFYGHNHIRKIEFVDKCTLCNPGEICAQKTGVGSFAVFDTRTLRVEIIELEDIITLKSSVVDDYLRDNMERLNFRSKDSFNHL